MSVRDQLVINDLAASKGEGKVPNALIANPVPSL